MKRKNIPLFSACCLRYVLLFMIVILLV